MEDAEFTITAQGTLLCGRRNPTPGAARPAGPRFDFVSDLNNRTGLNEGPTVAVI